MVFNQIYLNEGMLPKHTYIHINIYTYIYIYIYTYEHVHLRGAYDNVPDFFSYGHFY